MTKAVDKMLSQTLCTSKPKKYAISALFYLSGETLSSTKYVQEGHTLLQVSSPSTLCPMSSQISESEE